MNVDMARASMMVLVAIFLSAGCASATGQGTRTSTVGTASSGTARSQPASSRPIRSGDSGIAGQTVAIVCGGPASEQGCPRRAVAATIDILQMPSERRIATVRTDTRGNFRHNLLPGDYKLQAHSSSQMIWARPVTVRILRHQFKRTTITFAPRHPLPIAPGSASG